MSNSIAITGGLVVAEGGPPRLGDVLIDNGIIRSLPPLGSGMSAERVLDASDCVVLPGFIDAHVHGETGVFDKSVAEAALRQGVTTFILGQDGCSVAPGSLATRRYMARYFAAVNGDFVPDGPMTVGDYLDEIDRASYLNVAFLVPHGNVRMDIMSDVRRRADRSELKLMQSAVQQGLEAGAVGVSTGLDYVPSQYGDISEFAAIAAPVHSADSIFVSHVRGYGQNLPAGVEELASVSRVSKVKIHVSHLWAALPKVEKAMSIATGADSTFTFDAYPYLRGSSLLTMTALPEWVQEGGPDATLRRLHSKPVRDVLDHIDEGVASRLVISHATWTGDADLIGLSLSEGALKRNQAIGAFLCEVLINSNLNVGVIMGREHFSSQDCERIALNERHLGSSDGIFNGDRPHPRGWGAFTKLMQLYLSANERAGWLDVANHLATRAAARFNLENRGSIRVGSAADIAVIDPLLLASHASYEQPKVMSTGARHVLVNGEVVIASGIYAPSRCGQSIRAR